MYLIEDRYGSPVAVRPSIRDHLAARTHTDRIDVQLANGRSPEASIAAALRARALTSCRSLRDLAHGLRRAIARAGAARHAATTGMGVNSAQILSSEADLMELHRLLLTAGPVSVRGVAQTHILLTNGAGPLYNPRTGAALGPSLRRAIEAMDVLWDTPVG